MGLISKPKIKSIPYEEFKDNETLEQMIDQLNAHGTNVLVNDGRSRNWPERVP